MPARKTPPKKAMPAKTNRRPVRREVGALVCFLLGIFTLFSLFGAQAWLLDVLRGGLDFIVGGGFILFPFMSLCAAVVLLFHRGRPVILRVVCVFVVPVLTGTLAGLFAAGEDAAPPLAVPLADRFAWLLRVGLSRPVAAVLLVSGVVFCGFAILRLSPVAVVDMLHGRQRRTYEPQPVPSREPKPERTEKPAAPEKPERKKQRPDFDVPVYAGPDPEPDEPLPVGILPGRGEKVRTPAELLGGVPSRPSGADVRGNTARDPLSVKDVMPLTGVKLEPIPLPEGTGVPPWEGEPAAGGTGPDRPRKTEPDGNTAGGRLSIRDAAPPVIPELTPVASVSVAADGPLLPEETPAPYRLPPVSLLTATRPASDNLAGKNEEELKNNAERLIAAMQSFGIGASVLNVTRGPSVARYEIEPESGVRLSSLTSRADDIALSLGAVGVHIAPVPGKANVVGIEVPNRMVSTVYIRDLINSPEFKAADSPTAFVLGRDITGQNIVADAAKLTHLLIAGTTGSGKSVCMNTLITSMLYKASPDELRFIMVDPKMVELGVYNGIPHLLSPVVTDPKRAAEALEWAVAEMDGRYNLLMQRGKRDIVSYNEEVSREPDGVTMPRIVIIIDEMADLMMVARKEVETAVARIAQKARACGVHLILATQRPEAKVVTGIIKANTPSRIAFAVKGNLDSRIILDTGGAEKLVGRGDMLYLPIGAPKPVRVQGCYVSGEEVSRVVQFISESSPANYSAEMLAHLEGKNGSGNGSPSGGRDGGPEGGDPMLPAAIEVIVGSGQGSTSYLQRRLKLGYARAARLMDEMEERGIVGPFEGSKPRQVLITPEQWEEMK